ncbi:MAG TPA: GNAT family N-acetyltransferase [Solirubrobacterales bacterium]
MLEIREARPEDALEVAGVHVRAWQVAYRGLIDEGFLAGLKAEERAARYTFGSTGSASPTTLLAVERGTIHGFSTFGPTRDEDAPGAGEIHALYVDPPHWGEGAGRLLLAESRHRLLGAGHAEGVLWVLRGNRDAERFYRIDGWRRDGAERWEQPYGVRSRVIRYRRPLP